VLRSSKQLLFSGVTVKKTSFDQDFVESDRPQAQLYSFVISISLFVVLVAKFIYDVKKSRGNHLDYNIIWLAVNYFQFGAMRRALIGSVIYMSGVNLVTAAYLLYGISVILVLIFAYAFIKRVMEAGGNPFPFVLILGALLLFWSEDFGRTDILIAAILLAAALALIDGRIVLASLCLAIGFQVHEATAIYGLPLAAALLLQGNRYKNYTSTAWSLASTILFGGIAFYVAVSFMPRASNDFIVETISSRLPENFHIESINSNFALFAMLGGIRAAVDSICIVSPSIHHYLNPFVALLMVALALASMSGFRSSRWALSAIATVPSVVILWLTANDMGRWAALAIFNVWILCASSDLEPMRAVRRWAWIRVAGAAVIIPLLFPLTIPLHFFYAYPSPLIEGAIEKLIGHPALRTFEECDPTWRASLS
jgi:hypothetical protein